MENKTKNEPRKKIYRIELTDVQAQALRSLGLEISSVIEPKKGELDPSTIRQGDILMVNDYKNNRELNGELIVVDEVFEHNFLSGEYRITAHLAREVKEKVRLWTSAAKLSKHQ